ncbi:MAG TPA: hypothetical protein DCL41_03305 [Bdellovibrionales bacterium]|nr:hypothetical protein [Pseudobdellovibrionaceae bacterium]HAG90868.1 hypothetical protein [Bdellovibrionales bacterium]
MNFFKKLGIRVKMAILYSTLSGAGLIVFCFFLFQFYVRSQQESFDNALYNFAADVSDDLEVDFLGRLYSRNRTAEEGKYFPFPLGKSFLEIQNLKGQVLLISKSLRGGSLPLVQKKDLAQLQKVKATFRTIERPKGQKGISKSLRLVRYFAHHESWPEPLILQVAVPMDLLEHERQGLIGYFLIGIPSFLFVVALLGVFLSRQAFQPVQRMTNRVKAMLDLKERIPVPKNQDEISELAETFNDLLDRLEMAFVSQDRFIANASHQLKTPLTILKGELEMLKFSKDPKEVSEFLNSASGEINHMINLVQDLLVLARVESGKDSISLNPVLLDEILLGAVARIQRLAEKKGIGIQTQFRSENVDEELDVEFLGDEELLRSMMENFLENAIKYSPDNSTVQVILESYPSQILIGIKDEGPGISSEDMQKIFDRFHRAQSGKISGSGLGLAVAQEIARIHGVKIDMNSHLGSGTQVELIFPRPSSAPTV